MYWLEDPGHAWLVVGAPWVRRTCGKEISRASFTSPLRNLAYLEEDVDAPLFLREARIASTNIPTRQINDFEDYIRRHGLRRWPQRKKGAA